MTFLRWLAQPVILARLVAEAAALLLLVYLRVDQLAFALVAQLVERVR